VSDLASEKAQEHIDRRRATVDKWENKETKQQRIGVAYDFWIGKQKYRIFKAADTLVEVVEKCQREEGIILDSLSKDAAAKSR